MLTKSLVHLSLCIEVSLSPLLGMLRRNRQYRRDPCIGMYHFRTDGFHPWAGRIQHNIHIRVALSGQY